MRPLPILLLFFLCLQGVSCSQVPDNEIRTVVVGLAHVCDDRFEYFNETLTLNARLALARHGSNGVIKTRNGNVQIQFLTMPMARTKESPRQALFETVNNYEARFVIGNACSLTAASMAEAAEELHIPFLVPVATVPSVTEGKRLSFPTSPSMNARALAYASFLDHHLKARRIAVLAKRDALSGTAFFDILTRYFADAEGVRVSMHTFHSESDLPQALAALMEERPDAVVFCPVEPHIFDVGRQLEALGYHNPLLGAQSGQAHEYAAHLPQPDMPVYCFSYWNPEAPGAERSGYMEAFTAITGKEPGEDDVYVYDTTLRLIQAVKEAGTLSPQSFQRTLASRPDLPGAAGHYRFNSEPVLSPLWLLSLNNGTLAAEEFRQHAPDRAAAP